MLFQIMTDLLIIRRKGNIVKIVALFDLGDTIFEMIYSGVRLLKHSEAYESGIFYDFMGQSFMFPIGLFLLLVVQGIVGIRLFGAAKDAITPDLCSATKKCIWWQRISYLLLFFLLLELFVLLYTFITQIYNLLTFFTLFVCLSEMCFRICGILVVGKFLKTIEEVHIDVPIVVTTTETEVLQVQSQI